MRTRRLGRTPWTVGALGLGAMPLSLAGRPSEPQATAVIHRALALGVTFIDTADAYCLDEADKHHNEALIRRALASYPGDTSGVVVATKGGLVRPGGRWERYGDPAHLRSAIRRSFEALGGERPIALWQLHAPDPVWTLAEMLEPAREAQQAGLIQYVGLSNVTLEQLREARRHVDVVSVQNQYNPWERDADTSGLLTYCEQEDIVFLPWGPLGGSRRVTRLREIPALREIADEHGISVQRLVLAWLLRRSPAILPIPGASRVESIEDSAAATRVDLQPDEIARIDREASPPSGPVRPS